MSVNKQAPDGLTNQTSTAAHPRKGDLKPGIAPLESVREETLEETEAHVEELTQALYAVMEAQSPTSLYWTGASSSRSEFPSNTAQEVSKGETRRTNI